MRGKCRTQIAQVKHRSGSTKADQKSRFKTPEGRQHFLPLFQLFESAFIRVICVP